MKHFKNGERCSRTLFDASWPRQWRSIDETTKDQLAIAGGFSKREARMIKGQVSRKPVWIMPVRGTVRGSQCALNDAGNFSDAVISIFGRRFRIRDAPNFSRVAITN